ncbi:Hypothetical protein CINCED_3A019645 [Cinara cedri]|uniref:DUF4817 domain-containing protein n=1 Tax=Cinara cedri TaxID=506608 RepID=A0A5E4N8C1_9HEMI|nr:Hypothetical protein CINCED_3A019645 [Cinara cedri]
MTNMNHLLKVDMLFIYWECQKNARHAAQIYAQRYPDSFIYNLERNIRTYDSSAPKGAISPTLGNTALDKEVEEQLLVYVRANPRVSTQYVVQHLRQGDAVWRLTFVAWLMTGLDENPLILNSILWTDESKFTNNGVINKQNNRYWDIQNPHWTFKINN